MAYLSGWKTQRIKITIDQTKIDTADLTWFPDTVFLTVTNAHKVFLELTTDAEYLKVAFTKADGETQLYAEMELFDVSEEKAIFHVSRDGWVIDYDADTIFYMYYDSTHADNTDYIGITQSTPAKKVWDDFFKFRSDMKDVVVNWTTQYEATVEPDSDGWTLNGTDYASVAGGILTIDTTGGARSCYYSKTPNIDFDAGVYVKTRIQMHDDTENSAYYSIWLNDGTQNERTFFRLWKNNVTIRTSGGSYTGYAMDTTDAYHTYELYIKGTAVSLYIDGTLRLSEDVESSACDDIIYFGDNVGVAGYSLKSMTDYFYYALNASYNPAVDTNILDSTSNANYGTKKGLGEPVEAAGKVGQGQSFDGTDDYIDCGDNDTLDFGTGDFVVEACIKLAANANNTPIFGNRPQGATGAIAGWYVSVLGTGLPYLQIEDNGGDFANLSAVSVVDDGNWRHLAYVFDRDANGEILINGVSNKTGSIATQSNTISNSLTKTIRKAFGTAAAFYGDAITIDELRISNIVRSAAWIKATHNSLWDTLQTYEYDVTILELSETLSIVDTKATSGTLAEAETLSIVDTWGALITFLETLSVIDSETMSGELDLDETLSIADTKVTSTSLSFPETLSIIDSFITGIIKQLSESFSIIDSKLLTGSLGLTETLGIVDSATFQCIKTLYETLSIIDSKVTSGSLSLAETLSIVDSWTVVFTLLETISITDTTSTAGTKTLNELLHLIDTFIRWIEHPLYTEETKSDVSWTKETKPTTNWDKETKVDVGWIEEIKPTIDWEKETKPTTDWEEETKKIKLD